jgi:hypothetical protein
MRRLKEKLGTKSLPTAELELCGTPARLVGQVGRGVATIATLFNMSLASTLLRLLLPRMRYAHAHARPCTTPHTYDRTDAQAHTWSVLGGQAIAVAEWMHRGPRAAAMATWRTPPTCHRTPTRTAGTFAPIPPPSGRVATRRSNYTNSSSSSYYYSSYSYFPGEHDLGGHHQRTVNGHSSHPRDREPNALAGTPQWPRTHAYMYASSLTCQRASESPQRCAQRQR